MLCIQTGKTSVFDPNRMRLDQPRVRDQPRDEMMTLFHEVEDSLDRTWDIAQRCKTKLSPVEEPFPKIGVRPATLLIASSNMWPGKA